MEKQTFVLSGCFLFGLLLYGLSIYLHKASDPLKETLLIHNALPASVQKVVAGPFLGVASDLNILDVFSIYSGIRNPDLNEAGQQVLWRLLEQKLRNAQQLDPYFWDIYRLTTGLLAFHPGRSQAAIEILGQGADARTWDWEPPFMAGYLAHDMLQDDKKAYRLMSRAINRPDAPSMATTLAATFLQQAEGPESSIQFLKYIRSTLPEEYHAAINARIKKLELERSSR